jgi:heterodisulfide reductase subunit C
MTVTIKKQVAGKGLLARVEKLADVDLSRCYQCQKCSSGCPVTGLSQSPPSEIIRRLQLGSGDELLENDMVWLCLSCETCYARCPMQIDAGAVMDALKNIAVEKGAATPKGNMPLFNRLFLRMVEVFGRSYDLPALGFYKLGSGSLTSDMDKLPGMLKKGKMAVLPPAGADSKKVKRIFRKVRQMQGGGK